MQTCQHYKIEIPDSIPDEAKNVFALTRRLPKNLLLFFQEKISSRTIYTGFYLKPSRVPAERWAKEPLKVLDRTFF